MSSAVPDFQFSDEDCSDDVSSSLNSISSNDSQPSSIHNESFVNLSTNSENELSEDSSISSETASSISNDMDVEETTNELNKYEHIQYSIQHDFYPNEEFVTNATSFKMKTFSATQKDVDYVSTKNVMYCIVSSSCKKKNLQGYSCLEQLCSADDLSVGNYKTAIELVLNLRQDILGMNSNEKHRYIEKLLAENVVSGTSHRLMVKYKLSHPGFRNGKCYV